MITLTLPWWFSPLPGYRGFLVILATWSPLRVRVLRVYARRHPPAPGTPAQAAMATMEVER